MGMPSPLIFWRCSPAPCTHWFCHCRVSLRLKLANIFSVKRQSVCFLTSPVKCLSQLPKLRMQHKSNHVWLCPNKTLFRHPETWILHVMTYYSSFDFFQLFKNVQTVVHSWVVQRHDRPHFANPSPGPAGVVTQSCFPPHQSFVVTWIAQLSRPSLNVLFATECLTWVEGRQSHLTYIYRNWLCFLLLHVFYAALLLYVSIVLRTNFHLWHIIQHY